MKNHNKTTKTESAKKTDCDDAGQQHGAEKMVPGYDVPVFPV